MEEGDEIVQVIYFSICYIHYILIIKNYLILCVNLLGKLSNGSWLGEEEFA